MTPPDDVPQSSTPTPSAAGSDVLTDRATPEPTVLSTVWEGPSKAESAEHPQGGPQSPALDETGARSPVLGWLLAPASRRRTLVITTVAALFCGVLAVGELNDPPASPAVEAQTSAEATQGSLSSRAVTAENPAAAAVVGEAVSADDRLRLVVEPVDTAPGSWMLDVQMVEADDEAAIVRFTVNGVVVEAVDRSPYRLLLNRDLLATLPNTVGEGRPLIVTASAIWPDGDAASPVTVVLPN